MVKRMEPLNQVETILQSRWLRITLGRWVSITLVKMTARIISGLITYCSFCSCLILLCFIFFPWRIRRWQCSRMHKGCVRSRWCHHAICRSYRAFKSPRVAKSLGPFLFKALQLIECTEGETQLDQQVDITRHWGLAYEKIFSRAIGTCQKLCP